MTGSVSAKSPASEDEAHFYPNPPGSSAVSLPDEELLAEYLATRRLAEGTRKVLRDSVGSWAREVGKPLSGATSADVSQWYSRLSARGVKPSTIVTWGIKLRMLTRFLMEKRVKKRAANYRAEEIWGVVPFADLVRETAKGGGDRDKVISEEELHALLRAAKHPRVKAFIAVLFESGCRKGELKSLKIRDITFGATYAEIRVSGKTGERTIPLVFSVPYLRAWLQAHPDRRPEQWLFAFERSGKINQMVGSSPGATIRYICQKAGIRLIHPHMLRHTRATEAARAGLGEYQMDSLMGWVIGSRSPRRYIHLSGRDHINAVLEAQGIEVPKSLKPKPMLAGGHCPNCDALIGASMLHCPGCGYILDPNMGRVEDGRAETFDRLLEELRRGRAESDKRMAELEERMEKRLRELRGDKGAGAV